MQPPNPNQAIDTANSRPDRIWYRWFQSLVPQRSVMLVETVGASPWTFQNGDHPSTFTIAGGTVTLVELSGDGVTWADTGVVAGAVPLQPFDQLRITHAGAPTCVVCYRVGPT